MTLRVGIVGCGMIAGGPVKEGRPISGNHAAACRAVEGVRLVAACDPDPVRRKAFARTWEIADTYASTDAMLESSKLDIVIVAAPQEAHEAACLAAIARGVRGVLCEKPFTGAATSAKRVTDAASAAGVAVVVNFMRRWDETHRALAQRIAQGVLGDVREVHASYTGTLRGNGAHFVDTLRMLVPGEWRTGWTSHLAADAADGPVDAVLEADRVRAYVGAVREADYFVFESQIIGTKGRARLLFGGNDVRLDAPAPHPDYPGYRYLVEAETLPTMTLAGAFTNALSGLVTAVRDGTPVAVPAAEHVASLGLVDAMMTNATARRETT